MVHRDKEGRGAGQGERQAGWAQPSLSCHHYIDLEKRYLPLSHAASTALPSTGQVGHR